MCNTLSDFQPLAMAVEGSLLFSRLIFVSGAIAGFSAGGRLSTAASQITSAKGFGDWLVVLVPVKSPSRFRGVWLPGLIVLDDQEIKSPLYMHRYVGGS